MSKFLKGAGELIGSIAGPLLGFGGQMYDTRTMARVARENTDKTIAHQKREAELAYQRSVEMWHMQNQYNSPEQQMQRFGAAGLNPHLIYGQGSAGNASSTPQYQPPNVQYRYAAPAYGAAVGSVIPTLMQVGSWLQNMRLTETEIQAKQTGMQRTEQLIEFLSEKNPREISRLDNLLSLYPYQSSMMESKEKQSWAMWNRMLHENQHLYGVDGQGGMRALERIRTAAQGRLTSAQAEWFEPATIMKLVFGGVLGLAGLGRFSRGAASAGRINQKARRVKTFYQNGRRRSQVVDY